MFAYVIMNLNFVQQSQNDAPHPQTYSLIDDRFGALEKTVKTFNVTLGTGQNKEGAKTRIRARTFYLLMIFAIFGYSSFDQNDR